MQPLSTDVLVKAGSTLVLGLVVGAVGTAMHRSVQPWGLVLCLLLVACAGLLSRSWGGGVALAGLAGGMFLSVTTLARSGPGGDVLVPAQQGIGWAWVLGAAGVLILVALAPRALFRDEPRGGRPRRTEPSDAVPAHDDAPLTDDRPAAVEPGGDTDGGTGTPPGTAR